MLAFIHGIFVRWPARQTLENRQMKSRQDNRGAYTLHCCWDGGSELWAFAAICMQIESGGVRITANPFTT
jgi:hypothetical protein